MTRLHGKNLKMQACEELRSRFTPGRSKHQAKQEWLQDKSNRDCAYCRNIFSYKTLDVYIEHSIEFAQWMRANYPAIKRLPDALPYVNEWLQSCIDKGQSPSTLSTKRAAICKLYNKPASDFIELPKRQRDKITRSREFVKSDKNFNEDRHKELVEFCRSTGLRRSELEGLRGDMLISTANGLYLDFSSETNRKLCKGGRSRIVPVYGDNELVIRLCNQAGQGRVFEVVNAAADIHAYRADYAKRVYDAHKRPIEQIPHNERYYCRRDKVGVVYDKRAMLIASQALGHNRIEIIAGHYLY